MDIRHAKHLIILFASLFLVSPLVYASDSDSVNIVARFWGYPTEEVKAAILNYSGNDIQIEEYETFNLQQKNSYHLLSANSCIESKAGDFSALYVYICENAHLNVIFNLSQKEPRVFLFVRDEDVDVVVGHLERFVVFLREEEKHGMPVDTSYREFLLEISHYLSNR